MSRLTRRCGLLALIPLRWLARFLELALTGVLALCGAIWDAANRPKD